MDNLKFNSLLHGGWLKKRSNGLKSVVKRRRYFVLTVDGLYWFQKEKSKFVMKGCIAVGDLLCHGLHSDGSLHLQRKPSGKNYFLTGKGLHDWCVALDDYLRSHKDAQRREEICPDGKFSRKSTGTNSAASSGQSSLPVSQASSLLEDADDCGDGISEEVDDLVLPATIGVTILTKESLLRHDSELDVNEKSAGTAVRDAISFFEQDNVSEASSKDLPRNRARFRRQRLISHFGPNVKDRLRAVDVCGEKSDQPSLEDTCSFDEDTSTIFSGSELSEEIMRTNLEGAQTLGDLASSIANMMSQLDFVNSTIEFQTQDNLFMCERAELSGAPSSKMERDREESQLYHRYSTVTPSLNSENIEEMLDADDDQFDDESSEEDEEVEAFIQTKLLLNQPVSMVDLMTHFGPKDLPEATFRKIYANVRSRIERNRQVSRRQPAENLSMLSLLFGHLCDLESGAIEADGLREMLKSHFVRRKLSDEELAHLEDAVKLPVNFPQFVELITDLPAHIGYSLRLGLEDHVNSRSPFKRVALRLSELDLLEFDSSDGFHVKSSDLDCVGKGWCLVKIDGETIFTQEEKDDCLANVDPNTSCLFEFIAGHS